MLSSLLARFEPGVEMVRAFYVSRELRERRALLVLAWVLVCLLFYALLLAPLNNHLTHLRANIKHDEATLAWAKSADAILSSSNAAAPKSLTPVEALAVLQAAVQASAFSSAVKSLKQNDDHGIRLQLDAVPFDQWMIFLGTLEANDALVVSELTVDSAGALPGLVNVSVVFTPRLTPA